MVKLKIFTAISVVLLSCCRDERQINPITNHLIGKKYNLDVAARDLFDSRWSYMCIVIPGGMASVVTNTMLGRNKEQAIDILDPEEFGEYLWKVVLISSDFGRSTLYTLHKQDFEFEFEQCVQIDGVSLRFRVGIGDPPKKEDQQPFYNVQIEPLSETK